MVVCLRDLADIADVITKSKRIVQSYTKAFDVGCKFDLGVAKVDFRRFILVVMRCTVAKDDGFGNRLRVSCININNNTMTFKSGLEVTQCH